LGRESKWKVKPKKRCNHRTCRTLIDYDKRYCSSHDGVVHKRYDASRDVEVKRFYSSGRWTEMAKQTKLRDDYLCQECLSHGLYVQGNIAEHITPVKQDWGKRWDMSNTQTLCISCHNKKTAKENTGQKYLLSPPGLCNPCCERD